MRKYIILTLLMTFSLQAEQNGEIKTPAASSKAELKREMAEIESQIKLLKARYAQLKKELEVSSPVDRAKGELIIEVLLDGNVIVENEKFSKEQLKKKLLKHPDSNKNLAVALTMGPNVAYKHTIDIYNICLEAGFPNIGWRGYYWKEQTEQE